MKSAKPLKPTDAELGILGVLWNRGPSTVRDVWEQLAIKQQIGYTTTLKTMQIMFQKGLLKRDEGQRSHIYEPLVSQEQTQRQAMGHLLERVFAGSWAKLAMQALSARKATRSELAEIRKLLDEMEGGAK